MILIQSVNEKNTSPKQKVSIRESGILRHFGQQSGVDVSKKINILTKNDSENSIGEFFYAHFSLIFGGLHLR